MPKKSSKRAEPYLIKTASAAAIFVFSTFLAVRHHMGVIETKIFWQIYNWPAFLHPLFLVITQFGSAWALLVVIYALYSKKQRRLSALLLLNAVAAHSITSLSKILVARQRPDLLVPHVKAYDFATGSGFPSGHTTSITVIALTLLPFIPGKYRWLAWMSIILVGLSRVNLGVHAPLDIVGGFAVGWAVVTLSNRWLKPLFKL